MSSVTEDKQKEKRARIMAAAKGSSGEPSVTEEGYGVELLKALNYYNAFEDYKTKRDWVVKYTKKHNMQRELDIALSDAQDYQFTQVGAIMRLKERGQYVSPKHWNDILAKFDTIKELTEQKRISDKEFEEKKGSKPVVDKDKIAVDQCMDRINGEIDQYIISKSTKFDLKPFLESNNINSSVKKTLSEILQGIYKELSSVDFDNEDDQMTEGYSNFTKREFKGYKDFIDSMLNSCVVQRKQRKAKVAKQKPISKIIDKIRYKESEVVAGVELKSMKPETIVGAKEVWLYNVNNRIMWVCRSTTGLSVKGSTILGFDNDKSCGKRLRKPDAFFKGSLAKSGINDQFDKLDQLSFPFNNRTNDSLIILRVFN